MATRLPLVLIDGVIQRLPSGDSLAAVPTEGIGLPDPTNLADGCTLVVQNGQWVVVCPPVSGCTNILYTSDGDLFNTSEGGFCLPEPSCANSLYTSDGDLFNTSEGGFCLPDAASPGCANSFYTSDGDLFNTSEGGFCLPAS